MGNNQNIDIIEKIKYIERLKCRMLSQTAGLFETMSDSSSDFGDKKDILSELLISVYLLSEQMGIGFDLLEQCAAEHLENTGDFDCHGNERELLSHLKRD